MDHAINSGFSPEALDFAPDILAIQERPPSRMPRAMLLATSTLIGLMLVWASLAKLDIIAVSEGRLTPVTYTKVVQPAESGVVTEILVKDGQAVKGGELLMRLDARLTQADNQALGTEVAMKRLTLKRIEAELADQVSFARPSKTDALMYSQVQAQFRARRQAYLDAAAQETDALTKAKADLKAAEQVLQKLEQVLPVYKQTADAHERLVKEGYFSEIAANEKKRDLLEKEQDLRAQASIIESLKATIAQTEKKLMSVRSNYRSQLENERIETLAALNKGGQEFDKNKIRQGLLDIKAPTDGVVKDLAAVNPGQVVSAGVLLMNIVPRGEALQAEVLLKNEDAGFVAVGQPAMIKIAAFPFQKYGLIPGSVAVVSADSQDPKSMPQGQAQTLTYKALLKVDQTELKYRSNSGTALQLQPGMLVLAEIHQGQRTVMEYLLSPVKKVAQEAARER